MKIGLLQSSYLPWLGYFDQIAKSDIFVFYDDVQYEEGSFRNRNKIKTRTGWTWLTVPVYKSGLFGQRICDVKINNTESWQRKHIKALELNYHNAEYFEQYFEGLRELMGKKWENISDLNMEIIKYCCTAMGISSKLISSLELKTATGQKTERILSICQELEANEIIVGAKAKNYLEENLLTNNGITIEYQEYHHPEYNQLYPPFEPFLSIVDLIFNEGDRSLKILYDDQKGTIICSGETHEKDINNRRSRIHRE